MAAAPSPDPSLPPWAPAGSLAAKFLTEYRRATAYEKTQLEAAVFHAQQELTALTAALRMAAAQDAKAAAERRYVPDTPDPPGPLLPAEVVPFARTIWLFGRPVMLNHLARLAGVPARVYVRHRDCGAFTETADGYVGLTPAGRAALADDPTPPPDPPERADAPDDPTAWRADRRANSNACASAVRGGGGWPVPLAAVVTTTGLSGASAIAAMRCAWFARSKHGYRLTRAGLAAASAATELANAPAAP